MGRWVMRAKIGRWYVSGLAAWLLMPILIPIAILANLLPLRKTADLTAEQVVDYLRDFLADAGGPWDWDDFTSVPITDPALETIRNEADMVRLPLTETGREKLRELLARAEALL